MCINSSVGSKIASFSIRNKQLCSNQNIFLFGPSGCGKSTLLNLITGLDNSDKGEIYFRATEAKVLRTYVQNNVSSQDIQYAKLRKQAC